SALLRWVLLPFLLLAGVTMVAIAGELLRVVGIFDYNILFHNPLMSRLGIIDNVLQVVIAINSIFLVLFGVPAAIVQRDLKRPLNRVRVRAAGPSLRAPEASGGSQGAELRAVPGPPLNPSGTVVAHDKSRHPSHR